MRCWRALWRGSVRSWKLAETLPLADRRHAASGRAETFDCAVGVYRGAVLGVTPKTYLPNYREFYERRQFTSGTHALARELPLFDARVPFGNDLLYRFTSIRGCTVHIETCEDLWVPIPPARSQGLAGATVLVNLSASNVTIDKADYRRLLCPSQSGSCIAAYAYAAAGSGESTTDLAWDGHGDGLRERGSCSQKRSASPRTSS